MGAYVTGGGVRLTLEPARKAWTAERTLTATQRSAVAAVTTLKQPQTMSSGSEPARGARRCRGASPPPACGVDEEEAPAAADALAMARVGRLAALPGEWKESGAGGARRVRWKPERVKRRRSTRRPWAALTDTGWSGSAALVDLVQGSSEGVEVGGVRT
jgi:hypothetical protein